jgi:type II secretory pathway component PulF
MTRFSWPTLDISRKLSAEEAAELAARVAELTKAGLPLGKGLRALAGELASPRLSHVLRTLADRIDAGDDLAVAVDSIGSRLPPHLRGLILAGLRSGRLPDVLEEYVDLEHSQAELQRRLWASLLYPFLLLAIMTALAVFARVFIIGAFVAIFQDFKTDLPFMTLWFIHSSWPMTGGMVALLCLLTFVPVVLAVAPQVRWMWPILYRVPMMGPLLRWSHAAQFSRLMGMLLDQQVPLPDALRLTSEGLRDADLAWGCRRVADEVENGQVLYERMAELPQFPPSMIPVIEWGQRAPALPDSFRAAAEMFEGRVRSQGSLLEALLLPVMLLLIVGFVGTFVTAMFLPLISLIQKLS